MKKEIEIEKWFRAKGTDKYFKTGAEAAEYARKNVRKEILISLKSEIRMIKQGVERIKQLEIMIAEAKSKTVDLRKTWKVIETLDRVKLESKGAKASMLLFFKINLESKKGLYYARELVKYYGTEQIKMISREIRKRKERVKDWQRKYSELEG